MAEGNPGCFAWLLSFEKSCNERWARFRNRFRQRFYARRGKALDPETLLDETGAPNMVVKKTPYKCNKVVPQNQAPTNVVKDNSVVTENARAADTEGFDKLVEEYVSCIIAKAADLLKQPSPINTKIISEKSADDSVSLSSSIISQIADTAVTESLSNVVLEADINHSAIHNARPKTLREFKEAFGIVEEDFVDDCLLTVSI